MLIAPVFNSIKDLKLIDKLINKYSSKLSTNTYVTNAHYSIELEKNFYQAILDNDEDNIIKYCKMLSSYQMADLCI